MKRFFRIISTFLLLFAGVSTTIFAETQSTVNSEAQVGFYGEYKLTEQGTQGTSNDGADGSRLFIPETGNTGSGSSETSFSGTTDYTLPQTGDATNLPYVCTGLGIILFLFLMLKKKRERTYHSKLFTVKLQ